MADTDISELCNGIDCFARSLQKHLNKHNDNALISPIGAHAFLTLISHDPWFHNKNNLNSTLLIDVNVASEQYKRLFEALGIVSGLQAANVSYLNQHIRLLDTFKSHLEDRFLSKVNSFDFTKQEDVTRKTNSWFNEKTAGKIDGMDSLPNNVNFVSLNATHFKGDWAYPFAVEDTVPATFRINRQNTVEVQMMRKKGEFYCKNCPYLSARVLKLPFAGSNVNLVIVLPNEVIDISDFDEQILYDDLTLDQEMKKQELDVSLPKFKIEEASTLSKYLKEMGLEEIFTSNLIGIVDGETVTCGELQQKTFLDVNEAGSEVAAGTLSTVTKSSEEKVVPKDGLVVYEANISTEVSNRFAKTRVVWRVKNTNANAADAQFKVILTETAFITEFVMEIEGKSYKSYIKEKEEAQNIYKEAMAQGQSAGLVEAKTRDSKEFTVSVNLEPEAVAVFSLTYEEMLQRIHDQYELVLNICPGQIVDDLSIEVRINETRPLKFVKVPPLRSGNDMNVTEFAKYLDPKADIKMINAKTATIKFRPDSSKQKSMTHYLGNKTSDGLTGQFVVQYDVEREPRNGEVLLQDGYFVHFFAPNDLDPLPKHVVFVLDTSGSMMGRKIQQLQDAMVNILGDLRKEDMLSIIEFNREVVVWDIELKSSSSFGEDRIKDFKEPFAYLKKCILADPKRVSDRIISNAKEVVQNIRADGGTFMIGGLQTSLYLVQSGLNKKAGGENESLQPIIVFLTDGEPNVGISSTDEIVELVTHLNNKNKVPIFSLSFGDYADKDFLRKLSLKNWGFSRHIYEAADASLQLQEFYKQISSPLLHNIKFKYDEGVNEITRTWFPIYFRGSELVVAGRFGGQTVPQCIDCWGPHGPIIIESYTATPVTSLERLWAYLTVKQLLDERDTAENPQELTKRARDLALKYSFVTDVTSLVVVKPKETTTLGNQPTNIATAPVKRRRRMLASLNSASVGMSTSAAYMPMSFAHSQMYSCNSASVEMRMSTTDVFTSKKKKKKKMKKMSCSSASVAMRRAAFAPEMLCCEMDSFDSDMPSDDFEKKVPEGTFTVDRPFLVMLQAEINGKVVVLFRGFVCKPSY